MGFNSTRDKKDRTYLPEGWVEKKVIDIANKLADAPFGSNLKSKDYVEKGIPVVQGRNIKNNQFEWNKQLYVSPEKMEKLQKHTCRKGDLVFPKVGTIGGCAILPDIEGYDEFLLSTNMMSFNVNEDLYHLKYLYYYFSNPYIQKKIQQFSSSSVQPVFNFTSLKKFKVICPPLNEQKQIASILSCLDDKIQLNNQINQNLEELAQAIFNSWFIDFEPFRDGEFVESDFGLIPKGWNVANTSEVLDINPRRKLSKGSVAPYLEMKNVPEFSARIKDWDYRKYKGSGTKFLNGDILMARITPCLENGKTVYVDFLPKKDIIGWGSTEFIVLRSKEPFPTEYTYFLARSEEFRAFAISQMTGSSGRQRVPVSSFDYYNVVVPDEETLKKFEEIVQPIMQAMKRNDEESNRLAQIRNTLLPKLMSGEIRVPLEESK